MSIAYAAIGGLLIGIAILRAGAPRWVDILVGVIGVLLIVRAYTLT